MPRSVSVHSAQDHRPVRACARKRRGFVMVVVLIVVAILSLAGLRFVRLMATENTAVHLRGKELQAECLVGSGEAVIKRALATRDRDDLNDDPARFRGILVVGTEKSRIKGRFTVLSPKREDGEASGVRYGLENESAKLNLSVLPQWDEAHPDAAREALLKLPGMTEETADALLDWVDADAAARPMGAEADYYKGINVPYAPRNGPPGCMEELLLIKGISRELLFGGDANFNYRIDSSETAVRESEGPPWVSFLTLYSAEANVDAEGNPRVYLNDKDLRKMYGALTAVLTEEQARFIILYRQYGPASGGGEAAAPGQAPSSEEASGGQVRLRFDRPAEFDFKTVLDVVGASVEIPGRGRRKAKTIQSPFQEDPASMASYLPALLEKTTTNPAPVIRGRINIDQAPTEVLAGIPELGPTVAQQLGSSRGSGSDEAGIERLLTQNIVDLAQMKKILPYVTTGGDVYRAQVVGFFDGGGPVARAEVVVDATAAPPRRVYWKDLKLYGLAFSREKLGGESDEE